MNKQEYVEYENRFAEFMRLNELNNLTRIDNVCHCFDAIDGVFEFECDCDEDYQQEPFFSWRPCEVCQTRLGGNRIDASGYSRTGVIYEFVICTDCEYYAEYGQLDDMTMMDMK